ncbi:unnamed protein product [Clonostachys chloroleuca]|uniref:Uncharacterized protein n=1 Tax=Clonostachys chloroleuca TaxID=1926264 RepID=A0AA35M9M6_9HYPO|nr:unnamed protein product [Clonostachys chloroleuca]
MGQPSNSSFQTTQTSEKCIPSSNRSTQQPSIDRKKRHSSRSSRSRRSSRHLTAEIQLQQHLERLAYPDAMARSEDSTGSPRQYESSPAPSSAPSEPSSIDSRATSSTSTTISSTGGGLHDGNCHFAYSAELRMVDTLVSLLAQNARGQSSSSSSSSSSGQP